MFRNKRGQVTLFIIIAIIIVAAVILSIFAYRNNQQKKALTAKEFLPVEQAMQDCTKETAEDALILAGFQGGYTLTPTANSLETDFADISYFFYEGRSTAPSIETIKQELEGFVNETLPACLESLNLNQFGLSYEEPKTDVTISNEAVLFDVSWPVTAKKAGATVEFEKSSAQLNVRLNDIYNTALDLANKTGSRNMIPLTNTLKTDFNVTMATYDSNTLIYMISDSNSSVKDEPYNFWFAIKFKYD